MKNFILGVLVSFICCYFGDKISNTFMSGWWSASIALILMYALGLAT